MIGCSLNCVYQTDGVCMQDRACSIGKPEPEKDYLLCPQTGNPKRYGVEKKKSTKDIPVYAKEYGAFTAPVLFL